MKKAADQDRTVSALAKKVLGPGTPKNFNGTKAICQVMLILRLEDTANHSGTSKRRRHLHIIDKLIEDISRVAIFDC